MTQAMSLESLSTRIYGEILANLQQRVRKISDLPCYVPKSLSSGKKKVGEESKENTRQLDAAATPTGQEKIAKHQGVLDSMIKTNVLREAVRNGPVTPKSQTGAEQEHSNPHGEVYLLK